MANTKHQMSETHLLGLLLALVGGFLDAYTYVCRGHVFANAQNCTDCKGENLWQTRNIKCLKHTF